MYRLDSIKRQQMDQLAKNTSTSKTQGKITIATQSTYAQEGHTTKFDVQPFDFATPETRKIDNGSLAGICVFLENLEIPIGKPLVYPDRLATNEQTQTPNMSDGALRTGTCSFSCNALPKKLHAALNTVQLPAPTA